MRIAFCPQVDPVHAFSAILGSAVTGPLSRCQSGVALEPSLSPGRLARKFVRQQKGKRGRRNRADNGMALPQNVAGSRQIAFVAPLCVQIRALSADFGAYFRATLPPGFRPLSGDPPI